MTRAPARASLSDRTVGGFPSDVATPDRRSSTEDALPEPASTLDPA
jgi:hypothetical protein